MSEWEQQLSSIYRKVHIAHLFFFLFTNTDTAQKCRDVCWRACAFIYLREPAMPSSVRAKSAPFFFEGGGGIQHIHTVQQQQITALPTQISPMRGVWMIVFFTPTNITAGNKGGVYHVETWLRLFGRVCAWVYGLTVWACGSLGESGYVSGCLVSPG